MDYNDQTEGNNEMAKKPITAWVAGDIYCLREVGSALIYCVDAPGPYPIHGRFLDIQGENTTAWARDGHWSGASPSKSTHQLDLTILHKV